MGFKINVDRFGFAKKPEPDKVSKDYAAQLAEAIIDKRLSEFDPYSKAETNNLLNALRNETDTALAETEERIANALAETEEKTTGAVEGLKKGEGFNVGAIKAESTDFFVFEYSGNLYNPDTITRDTLIGQNGGTSANTNYFTTDYIKVKPGETLRRQFTYGGNRYDNSTSNLGSMYIAVYDKDKKSISSAFARQAKYLLIPDGGEYVRVSMENKFITSSSYTDVALILQDDATVIPFEKFGSVSSAVLKSEYLPPETVQAYLPPVIYCAVGRTIEIYNSQMCPALTDGLYIRWQCAVGKALDKKFSIKGMTGNIGEHDLTASIIDKDLNVLWSKTVKLRIVEDNIDSLSVCAIGDSLTNNKPWEAEVINLNNGISFVGTMEFNKNKDANGVTRPGFHEGRSGWSAKKYLSAGDAENNPNSFKYINPFYNSATSKFDWNYYVTNSLAGVSPDAVILFLGTNNISIDPKANGDDIITIINSIRSGNSDIPIFVINTLYRSGQNGIGNQTDSDGYAKKSGQYKYSEDMKVFNLMKYLNDSIKALSNVYIVPVALCHDSEHNYGAVETPVNPRSTITEPYPVESIHPQNSGYYQIADNVYSTLCGNIG